MLIKDILGIKPGTYIKGFKSLMNHHDDNPDFFYQYDGRRVTFDLNGWDFPEKSVNENYMIRTPWYVDLPFPKYNKTQLYDLLKTENYMSFKDEEYVSTYTSWASFKFNEPIGIHLGTYCLRMEIASNFQPPVAFYTKILRSTGEVGFICLITRNIKEKALELL